MIGRAVASVVGIVLYSMVMALYNPAAMIITGQAAGAQFAASNAAFLQTSILFSFFSGVTGWIGLALLAFLILVWYQPVKKWITTLAASIVIIGVCLVGAPNANAYYDQKDFTEAYTILPNESAFWIPSVGDNKSTQVQMDSEEYLKANKLATKMFIVPHAKLSGTGSFWDYYVPAGRLIIVDRTTYSHEWVDATDRGTGNKKEGFPCQSKEGINITAGVSVGSSVSEAQAAKFLYNFGVRVEASKAARNDPVVIFQTVYTGRPLWDVMQDIGRKKIQTLVCNEIGQRTFDQANAEMIKIMENVEKGARAYFDAVGITLNFIGWADTFGFDKEIQHAVNSSYVAKTDAANAALLGPVITTVSALASANALRSFGNATDGKFPTTVVGDVPSISSMLGAFTATNIKK
jgi:hypothetical protein